MAGGHRHWYQATLRGCWLTAARGSRSGSGQPTARCGVGLVLLAGVVENL